LQKQEIINSNLYEYYDDYFIAYKNVKKDRHSYFNFQHQYLKVKEIENHADYSKDMSSFGLSVRTKEQAMNREKGIVLEVRIKYEDVARISDDCSIRCSKLIVLN
jgi:hypothetical protein